MSFPIWLEYDFRPSPVTILFIVPRGVFGPLLPKIPVIVQPYYHCYINVAGCGVIYSIHPTKRNPPPTKNGCSRATRSAWWGDWGASYRKYPINVPAAGNFFLKSPAPTHHHDRPPCPLKKSVTPSPRLCTQQKNWSGRSISMIGQGDRSRSSAATCISHGTSDRKGWSP